MQEESGLLSNKRRRRMFFSSGLAAFVALLGLRFFIIPYFTRQPVQDLQIIATSILDNLMVALVSSMSIAALVLWLSPRDVQEAMMEVLEPAELITTLRTDLAQTTEFWYRGHTARWTRSVTLPQLANDARIERVSKSVYLIVLDPRNEDTCHYYAQFQRRVRPESKGVSPTAKRTQLEVYATIISAYAWSAQETSLDISVALTDRVSLFRVDLSSRSAVITKPHVREPALRYTAGSLYYRSFREDVLMDYQQSYKLSKDIKGIPLDELDKENARVLLSGLGFTIVDLTDEDMMEIIQLARKAESPYPS